MAMLRASTLLLPPFVFSSRSPAFTLLPALAVLRNLPSPLLRKPQTPINRRIAQSFSLYRRSTSELYRLRFGGAPLMADQTRIANATASFSPGSASGGGREILVQHLLVKEDDQKLLLELQKRAAEGEDLSDLAVEYSICPSKEEAGMLGWVSKGQMVPEFEETAFSAPLNNVVKCKTKFGWHLLQVLSEREESIFEHIQPSELHKKLLDPTFLEEAQLIDVREYDEVREILDTNEELRDGRLFEFSTPASLPGFKFKRLSVFGSWGPDCRDKYDPQKETYVLSQHGMRSLQAARWFQTQGFKKVYNVWGGIHEYALKVDPSVQLIAHRSTDIKFLYTRYYY